MLLYQNSSMYKLQTYGGSNYPFERLWNECENLYYKFLLESHEMY